MEGVQYGNGRQYPAGRCLIDESDVILPGYAVRLDIGNATADRRTYYAKKPNLANAGDLYGVVVSQGKEKAGPNEWDVLRIGDEIQRGVQVYTDENIVAGDYLAPIPETYKWGKAVVGPALFRATETIDRSTNAGLVTGDLGIIRARADLYSKIFRFEDHFFGERVVSATADRGAYVLLGTGTPTAAFADALGPEAAAAAQGAGVLTVAKSNTAADEAYIQINGEPFRLDAGKSIFMRARIALSALSANIHAFIGLALAATTNPVEASGTDFLGFKFGNTVLSFIYAKDGTSQAMATDHASWSVAAIASPAIVATEFVEVAVLVRNRGAAASQKEITIWVNGVRIAHTTVGADVCDNESLTFIAGLAQATDTGTPGLLIDRLELVQAL